ncbi:MULTISPECIES: DUF3558 family protein [Actinosynnema]|uniref:DUF3558 family protein n=1 Tax=Actinosynnema TaxID=40566 RepID=UPI0020A3BCFB|nr:DUF3558 family protein [Actinosynnema pretiosum]
MTSRRFPLAVLACAAVLATAACTPAPTSAVPTTGPAGSTAPSTSSSGPASAASASSASPRASEPLLHEGLDACALLTPQQRATLNLPDAGKPMPVAVFASTGCRWRNVAASTESSVLPILGQDIGSWQDGSRPATATEGEDIRGLPTLTLTVDTDPGQCNVAVRTGEGQHLLTTSSAADRVREDACARARALAEAAVRTLLA